jgi:hypothetical protein
MSDTPRTDGAANESIVRVYETSKQLERELADAIAQRDELLEALESIINADDEAEAMMRKMGIPAEEPMEIFVAARAVIAKVKGEIHE